MEAYPIWYVEGNVVMSVNGKAKGLTPNLQNAFQTGKVTSIPAAVDLFY
jgi:hypothetical protein